MDVFGHFRAPANLGFAFQANQEIEVSNLVASRAVSVARAAKSHADTQAKSAREAASSALYARMDADDLRKENAQLRMINKEYESQIDSLLALLEAKQAH